MQWLLLIAMTLGVAFTNADAEANEIRHFDPHQYEKYERNVPCPAIRRDTEEETAVEINISGSHAASMTVDKKSNPLCYRLR